MVLQVVTLLALLLANSRYRDVYETINHLPLSITLGERRVSASLQHWVNEGLMILFFFVLGLEVKRECLVGGLRRSSLVICMAVGGMLAPAGVYTLLVGTSEEAARGWGIPMATDTAFTLGILALLGPRAPKSAALILSALAIVPLFAFLNAGIALPQDPMQILNAPVTLGVAAGLILGKATGIFSFAWLGVRTGMAELPEDLNFRYIIAPGLLVGIGFTMSLFMAALAFEQHPALLMQAKLGILAGSLVAGAVIFVVTSDAASPTRRTPGKQQV